MKPKLKEDGSCYLFGGKEYPRLSSVLSVIHDKGLQSMIDGIGYDNAMQKWNDKAEWGSRVDALCSRHAEGGNVNADLVKEHQPEIWPSFEAFLNWESSTVFDYVHIQEVVGSEKVGVFGTPDFLIRDNDGNMVLVDLKTTDKIFFKQRIQVEFYRRMVLEMYPDEKIKKAILRIPKKGEFKYEPLDNEDRDWALFRAANFIYQNIY